MKFWYYDHQRKGKAFADVLMSKGWTPTRNYAEARFMLIDCEVNRHNDIRKFHEQGKQVFVYPHAARPDLLPDFDGYEASPHVTAHFVTARGHVEIMGAYGYPNPMPVVGWSLCPILPFTPRRERKPLRVVFAPIHSSRGGALSKIDKQINLETFNTLLPLVKAGEIDLKIRYLYNISFTGLPPVERGGIRWIKGNPDLSFAQIDAADVVVSHQTFLHLAVARGVPAVAMGEGEIPRYTLTDGQYVLANSWEKYRDMLMYPLDILTTNAPMELFQCAMTSDESIRNWRERMIGRQFDPVRFYKIFEEYMQ